MKKGFKARFDLHKKKLTWPANEAMWSAVLPFLVAASILALRAKSSSTTATWPSLEAK